MFDSLFDVYTNVESANELWDLLESKYMAKDSSSKKFLSLAHRGISKGTDSDNGKGKEVGGPFVNMTGEGGKNKHHKQNKGKCDPMRTIMVLVLKRNQSWNVESVVRLVTSKGISEVVDAIAWWIDSGATTYVCKDRCWFKTYEPVEDGYVLYMGDDHFAPVYGKRSVALEFSFEKTITLFNVLYVPKLQEAKGYAEKENTYFMETSAFEALNVETAFIEVLIQKYHVVIRKALDVRNDPSALPKGQTINVGSKDDVSTVKKATWFIRVSVPMPFYFKSYCIMENHQFEHLEMSASLL
nr:Ras-related protein RABA1f-like [Tanacetum cinerariifolium]